MTKEEVKAQFPPGTRVYINPYHKNRGAAFDPRKGMETGVVEANDSGYVEDRDPVPVVRVLWNTGTPWWVFYTAISPINSSPGEEEHTTCTCDLQSLMIAGCICGGR